MSEVTTRNKANTIESLAMPVGAIVVGACLVGLAKGLSFLAKAAIAECEKGLNPSPTLRSVATLRSETPLEMTLSKGQELDSLKKQAFKQLANKPLLTANRMELEQSLMKLDRAKTLTEFISTHTDMLTKLEDGHQKIFSTALLEAGKRAALKIGFGKIEALRSPVSTTIRFAATDALGRSLVTEISAPKDRDVRIETEVVGVSDGSCHSILDDFDKALEAEGVRSQPAKRKVTGGVCELAAVRAFVEKEVAPTAATNVANKPTEITNDAVKRVRRLNKKPLALNKHK